MNTMTSAQRTAVKVWAGMIALHTLAPVVLARPRRAQLAYYPSEAYGLFAAVVIGAVGWGFQDLGRRDIRADTRWRARCCLAAMALLMLLALGLAALHVSGMPWMVFGIGTWTACMGFVFVLAGEDPAALKQRRTG